MSPARCRRPESRRGSASLELLLVLPVLLVVLAAGVELGLLSAGDQRVADAAARGARYAARGASPAAVEKHVKDDVLGPGIGADARVTVHRATPPGAGGGSGAEFVTVVVEVPARAVAPDLLAVIGVRLSGETVVGHAVMMVE